MVGTTTSMPPSSYTFPPLTRIQARRARRGLEIITMFEDGYKPKEIYRRLKTVSLSTIYRVLGERE